MGLSNERSKLKISARILHDELSRLGSTVSILDGKSSLMRYTDTSGTPHLLFSTCSDKSSASGLTIANNKHQTHIIAQELGISVPAEEVCEELKGVSDFFATHKTIVIKPLDSSGGSGVTVNLSDESELKKAYLYAKHYDVSVIVQEYIEGDDVRLLVVDGVFRSAVKRVPAHVVGDGVSTIRQLIHLENHSSLREAGSMSAMDLIDTQGAHRFLGENIDTVPVLGSHVRVVGPANLSRGGTAHEATHLVTKQMIEDAQNISKTLKLGICGVDMIWDRSTGSYALIEVNATPGINMHNDSFWGTSSDAVVKYAEWLLAP